MWLTFLPEDRVWRILPFLVLTAVALWGLLAPGSQWRVLWGWQRRYRDVPASERIRLVRRTSLITLVVAVVVGIVVALLR